MSNHEIYALAPNGGGGGGPSAMDLAERDHLDNVELGRIEQYTVTLDITPEYAAMILAKYAPKGSNRRLRAGEVRRITRDIRAGRWEGRTHQGIAFDEDGNLTDGQHRMHACVAAGLPIRLPVTFGQPREVFPAVDQNAPRGAADLVFVAGLDIPDASNASATARNLLLLQRFAGTVDASVTKNNLDKRTVLEFATRHAVELNECVRIGGNTADGIKGGISRAQLATAIYIIRSACVDHRAIGEFFDLLKTGANLAVRSPALVLRDGLKSGTVLTGNPVGETRIAQLIGAVINGWSLWRGRRQLTSIRSIQWKVGDAFPQAKP